MQRTSTKKGFPMKQYLALFLSLVLAMIGLAGITSSNASASPAIFGQWKCPSPTDGTGMAPPEIITPVQVPSYGLLTFTKKATSVTWQTDKDGCYREISRPAFNFTITKLRGVTTYKWQPVKGVKVLAASFKVVNPKNASEVWFSGFTKTLKSLKSSQVPMFAVVKNGRTKMVTGKLTIWVSYLDSRYKSVGNPNMGY